MINGIIFQRDENRKYKGIEGDNWYLNDIYPDTLGDFFNDNIEKSWYDTDYVDVCNDRSFIDTYIKLSYKNNIKFRMLLCETEKKKPLMNTTCWNKKFIGYDYAYLGGSYYSAIFNDICSQRIDEFANIKLNEYGLFGKIYQMENFISKRSEYYRNSKMGVVEGGDFIIYKLYEIFVNEEENDFLIFK